MLSIKISSEGFFRKFLFRVLFLALVFSVLLLAFGFTRHIRASVNPTVTSLINFGNNKAKVSSNPAAAIKVVIGVTAGETLTAITVVATDSGSTSFSPTSDLAALATSATSGIALYNDAGTVPGSFDATDALVPLSSVSAFSSGSTTLTLTTPAAAGTFYLVYRTGVGATNGHGFVLTVPANGIATSSSSPTITPLSTSAITVDSVAPTINSSTTSPANNATGVPISAFIHMGFNENVDQSTINSSNITFTAGGTPVPAAVRPFPDGFDVITSSPPTFAASSRFAKVGSTATAFFNVSGTNPINPEPPFGYSVPVSGDIVVSQQGTFPAMAGVVTNSTLTSGTFAVNGMPMQSSGQITKFATPAVTGAVNDGTKTVVAGDIIIVGTSANPTGFWYNWHLVTTGAAINSANLRLDGSGAAPTFVTHPGGGISNFSTITPTATATDNGSTAGGTLAVTQGDLVFVKLAGGSYTWHLVTTTGNMSSDSGEGTAVIDNLANAAASLVAANSQMSKLSPGAQGASDNTDATALAFGDLIFANATANASNAGSYNFHMLSGGGTGIASSGIRFDNFPGSLTPSTTYVVTATTGVKDVAGNPLASSNTLTFTTGATGNTNTTPPNIQSSQPQPGNQQFAPNAPIEITFSVDMNTTGGSSGTNSVTNTANVKLSAAVNGQPSTQVTATNSYDSASRTVTIQPGSNLSINSDYVVQVATSTQSSSGTGLSGPYFLFFHTASATDTSAPTVLGVSPANNGTGVSLGAVVTAGFSKDMGPSTITSTTITLKKTSDSSAVSGNVSYNPSSHSASFTPSVALLTNTGYTLTIKAGSSGVKDLAGNQLGAASPANDYTSVFTTTATADTTKPTTTFTNADNFSVAVTFSETVKSGGAPSGADNIANYSLTTGASGSTLASVGLSSQTVTYDSGTRTAKITGLSLINGNQYNICVFNVQDLSGNVIDNTCNLGTIQNSNNTGGQIGPGGGTIDPGMQGMNPTIVTPMTRSAGVSSSYHVSFLASTSVPLGGQIVLTFPAGFTLSGAAAVSTTFSFCNADLNGPASGAPGIATVVGNNDAGTVTITTNGAATGANAFLCLDLSGITNSTVPSSSGYTVTIQTKDVSGTALQTATASPFFLGQAGSSSLAVTVTKGGTGVSGVTVFLGSPQSGGLNATTNGSGVATFSNLTDGTGYMVGLMPNSALSDVSFNSAPQPITISGVTTKTFTFTASTINIQGNVDGSTVANGTKVDVFASSNDGFSKIAVTLNGTATNAYSLPAQANTTYTVGVGPSIPDTFMTPGSVPPPPPTFTFMPPSPLTVVVAGGTVTGNNFTLGVANRTITGTVTDSSGTGVSNAGIFCRPVSSSTTGTQSGGFGTGGQTKSDGSFSVNVIDGVYLCGVFKPGMPPVPDKQISVASGGNTPSSLAFALAASTTSLTITGTVKDDSGNAISYAGVSGRKVNSSSDTTAIGGNSSNFVGGPTDANGAYTLYVSSGTWVVEAFAPGFGRLGTKTIVISTSSSSGQDFSAQTLNMGTITGTVTSGGSPVQGAMVRAETSTQSSSNMGATDSTGFYSLKVPAGTYSVKVFIPGVGEATPLTGVVVTSNTTNSGNDFALGANITITVNVTDGTNPITGAGVDVRDSSGNGNFTSTSTTSGINAVYVVKVPPGTYTVRVGHPAYGTISETTGVNTTRAITASAATTGATFAVTGSVTGNGSALSGAWVSLRGTPTGKTNVIFLGGQSASDGTFSVSVPAGSYKLRVDKPGYKSPAESTVTVTAAQAVGTIALTSASRTITGTVTLSGSPVSSAFVDASDGAGGYAVAQTDASGAFSLAVDNGTWSLHANAPGYQGGPLPVTVSGSNVSGQTLTLTAISGYTVKPPRPETITPSDGGDMTNTDIGSGFKLTIPPGVLGSTAANATSSNASTVQTKPNTNLPSSPTVTVLNTSGINISAADSGGNPITGLSGSVTFNMPYDETKLPAGTVEANLTCGVWNDATQTYDTLPSTVDTTANVLTCTTTHFSDFAPVVPSADSAPSTPTGLAIGNPNTGTALNLSWTTVSGAATYNVYKSTDNSSFPLLASPLTNSYQATGLTSGTTYYFKVSAVNSGGAESAATSAISGIPTVASGGGNLGGGGGGGGSTPSTSTSTITATTPTTVVANPTTNTATTTTTSTTATTTVTPSVGQLTFDFGTTTLRNGSRGEAVKELQRFLNQVLDLGLMVDGKLGPKTIVVIKTWQKNHGLVADGLIGPKTKVMMNSSLASPSSLAGSSSVVYNLGTVTLRNGSRGEAVKELQKLLNKLLNLGLVVDGKLGPKTIVVIKAWQKNHGLAADGLVGSKTKAAMNDEATGTGQ